MTISIQKIDKIDLGRLKLCWQGRRHTNLQHPAKFFCLLFFVVVVTTVASDTINMECIIINRTKPARPLKYTRTYFAFVLTSEIFWMIISRLMSFDLAEWLFSICYESQLVKSSRCILLFHQIIPIILFHSNIHKMVNSSSTVLNIESNPLFKINISFPKQRLDCKMKKIPLRSMHCVCRHAFVLAGMVKYVLIILFKI